MNSFIDELHSLLVDLELSAPKDFEEPNEWMQKARDLARLCIVNNVLLPELTALVPARERGKLLRSLQRIDAAGTIYASEEDQQIACPVDRSPTQH